MYVGRKRTYAPSYKRSKTPPHKKSRKAAIKALNVLRPLGDRQKSTHRYVETNITIDPGAAGVPASYIFWANGMYDPNYTGVGHQPLGFDQMTGFFAHFTVLWSKIKVTGYNLDVNDACFLCVRARDDFTPSGTLRNMIENGAKYKIMEEVGAGASHCVLNEFVDIAKFLGRPNPLNEDDLRGDRTANPDEGVFWEVLAAPTDNANIAPVNLLVEIEYCCMWTEPETITES